jgi:hypothetical protein
MIRIKRPAAVVGATVLLSFSLTACGGPPTDASEKDYCDAIGDDSYFNDLGEDADEQDYVDALQEFADAVKEVGTPEDIPDDAREGFEIQLDVIDDLKADDIDLEGDENPLESELSDDEKKKVDAYTEYENETCSEDTDVDVPDPEAS